MKIKYFSSIIFIVVAVILVNIIGQQFYTSIDLTEDKRYTISSPVKNVLKNISSDINIRVFLTADFLPADYKLFKKNVIEKLNSFKGVSSKINFFFEDPNKGAPELVRARGMALNQMGIKPVRVGKDQQGKDVYVFPAALVEARDTVVVNLMVNDIPGADDQTVIANSISLLEYNLAKGIQRAINPNRGVIAFTEGRGELSGGEVSDLDRTLRQQGYAVGRLRMDDIPIINPLVDVLIIAKPQQTYNTKDKFLIDQYIMNGGKVIWLIDRLTASLDSMILMNRYTPYDYPLEIEDMLFTYGFRIKPNLVMDKECTSVKLVTGTMGNAPQFDVFNWYFNPAVRPYSDNPIVKHLDRVQLRFASTIDTIITKKAKTKKTVLLRTSNKSMLKYSPVDLNFEFLREEIPETAFKEQNLPVAVLAEGEFLSNFEFNTTNDLVQLLKNEGLEHRKRSLPTKMLVVSDGDIARNDYNPETKENRALGFDRVSRYTFANKEFLMNAIEYMVDDTGIIQAKNKEVKLNLLDCDRAEKEKSYWQFINIVLPLLFLVLFGFIFHYIRKKRFGIQ